MIITCPACSTRYLMNSSAIHPSGQIVRCSGCGHSWKQYPLDLPSDPADGDPDFMDQAHLSSEGSFSYKPSSMGLYATEGHTSFSSAYIKEDQTHTESRAYHSYDENQHSSYNKPSSSAIRMMGWMIVLMIVGVIGVTSFMFKSEITDRLPTAYRFNLDQNAQFNFLSPVAEQKIENNRPILVITGRVMNMTAGELNLPDVKMSLLSGTKTIIASQVVKSYRAFPVEKLGSNQTTNFEIKADVPPSEALDLQLEFVPPPAPAPLSLDKKKDSEPSSIKAPDIQEIPPASMMDQTIENPSATISNDIAPLIQDPKQTLDNKPLQ